MAGIPGIDDGATLAMDDLWVGTWNVGDVDRAIEWVGKIKEENPGKTLIFAFQELDYIEPLRELENSLVIPSKTTFRKKFRMAIVVIKGSHNVKLEETEEISVTAGKDIKKQLGYHLAKPSKGAIYAKISIDDKPLRIVCVHLPFETDVNFINEKLETIKSVLKSDDPSPVLMLGDFNPRSNMGLPFEKNVDIDLMKANAFIQFLENPNTTQGVNKQEVIKLAKETDSFKLNQPDGYKIENFEEAEIDFMPSYKIDPETGDYSLKKIVKGKVKGRLPGYPDRIIYYSVTPKTLEPISKSYKLVKKKGYDHFPVSARFSFTKGNAFGRRRRRSKSRRRKRSRKRSRGSKKKKSLGRRRRRSQKRKSKQSKAKRSKRSKRSRRSRKKC